jgi:endonuclease G
LQVFVLPELKTNENLIKHSAMILSYDEKHEQARWVAHIILPDIKNGVVSRTNDFRVDSSVSTGSAEKVDYWDSGYDRGHLAPSADFRWSKIALSESYFYSNMSPQKPEFNREIWADLESFIREYVVDKNHQVYVVTGGILKEGLPQIGKNQVSVPEKYFKVIIDPSNDTQAGIGFIIANQKSAYPVINFALSIDSVEKITGINFFASLPDTLENKIESKFDIKLWQTGYANGNTKPLTKDELPSGTINTIEAKTHIDESATVCGTVVSIKYVPKSGNTFINLDQNFPNQIFWCTIWQNNRVNFSYDPQKYLINKKICVTGEIKLKYGQPSMSVNKEDQILILEEEQENLND